MSKRSSKRASELSVTKSDGLEEPADGVNEVKKIAEEVAGYDYKVRLMYSHTHHEKLVNKEEKKEILSRLEKVLKQVPELETQDADIAEEIRMQANRLLAVVAAHEYLKDGKQKQLNECLARSEAAGWDSMTDEPWRALVVSKAAKVSYQSGVVAVTQNENLRDAIEAAPKLRQSVIPPGFTGVPPTKSK